MRFLPACSYQVKFLNVYVTIASQITNKPKRFVSFTFHDIELVPDYIQSAADIIVLHQELELVDSTHL